MTSLAWALCVCVVKTPCENICVGYLECVSCINSSPMHTVCFYKRKQGFVYVFTADTVRITHL